MHYSTNRRGLLLKGHDNWPLGQNFIAATLAAFARFAPEKNRKNAATHDCLVLDERLSTRTHQAFIEPASSSKRARTWSNLIFRIALTSIRILLTANFHWANQLASNLLVTEKLPTSALTSCQLVRPMQTGLKQPGRCKKVAQGISLGLISMWTGRYVKLKKLRHSLAKLS